MLKTTEVQAREHRYTSHKLQNQLEVHVHSEPTSRVLHLGAFIRHGSQDEDRETSGIAHFIEHVLFNPWYFPADVAEIHERLLASGAYYEYSTSKEFTRLGLRCLPASLDDALEFFSLLVRPRQPQADALETERAIVLHEHAMSIASTHPTDHKILDNTMWGDRSIGLPILGRKENIERFTSEEIMSRMRSYYVPERTLLAMIGPLEAEAVSDRASSLFEDWRPDSEPLPEPTAVAEPGLRPLPTRGNRVTLQIAYPGVGQRSPERPQMEILADLLGGGTRSLLFHQLRQVKKLAYLVHAEPVTYDLGGYIAIYINCDRGAAGECCANVRSVLARLCAEGVRQTEVERAKWTRLVAALDAMEINGQYIKLFGRRALLGQPFSRTSEAENTKTVTGEKVAALADRMFSESRPAAVGMGVGGEELAELFR